MFKIKRAAGRMYVCLCVGVTEREIRETLSQGAETVEEVMYCTGAGTRCGGCLLTIEELVEESAEAKSGRRRLKIVDVATTAA
jgi:bacterioferritin-associated ferredoxin